MITSSNADFDEDGFGSVVRDLERAYLMLAELGVQGGDSPASTVINYNSELGGGNATMTPAVMGDTLFSSGGSTITGVTGGITKIPDLVGDVIGSITANVIANGAVTAAKMANSIGCSVIARWNNSTGVLGSLQATANNTVLKRTSNVLTFDKVNYAEIQDIVGVSVIGRSANSTGVSAAISASADGQVLQRLSGTLQFATVPIPSTLNVGTANSISGVINVYDITNYYKAYFTSYRIGLYILNIDNQTPLVDISLSSITPTGGWSTLKQIKIRELDAVESGVAKKILVLCSGSY